MCNSVSCSTSTIFPNMVITKANNYLIIKFYHVSDHLVYWQFSIFIIIKMTTDKLSEVATKLPTVCQQLVLTAIASYVYIARL